MSEHSHTQFGFSIYLNGKLSRTVPMQTSVLQVGSLASCQIQIGDPSIAKVHALIEFDEDKLTITDLGSQTGTLLNGQKVSRSSIKVGDVISCGIAEIKIVKLQAQRPIHQTPVEPDTAKQPPRKFPYSEYGQIYTAQIDSIFDGAIQESKILQKPNDKTLQFTSIILPLAGALLLAFFILSFTLILKPSLTVGASLAVQICWHLLPLSLLLTGLGLLSWGLVHYKKVQGNLSFSIGEALQAAFPTESKLPLELYPLVRLNNAGYYEVLIAPNFMEGDVIIDGKTVSLREAAKLFKNNAIAESAQIVTIPVKGNLEVIIRLGLCVFRVTALPCDDLPKTPPIPTNLNWPLLATMVLVYSFWVVLYFLIPVRQKNLSNEEQYIKARMALDTLMLAEQIEEEPAKTKKDDKKEEGGSSGAAGKRAKGQEGAMGTKDTKKTQGQYQMQGPRDNNTLQFAKEMAKEMSAQAGALGIIKSASGSVAAALDGGTSALGKDAETVLGGLLGSEPGEAYGNGGIGLVGAGQGGGGTGEGTVGLGNLGTIGKGAGGSGLSGYGSGKGKLKSRRAGTPEVIVGTAEVKGSLDKETIRRVIRKHMNQIKFCYEQSLLKHSRDTSVAQGGRMMVSFIMNEQGKVIGTPNAQMDGEITPGWTNVRQCVSDAIRRIEFPQTKGGMVQVNYPFTFKQSTGEE